MAKIPVKAITKALGKETDETQVEMPLVSDEELAALREADKKDAPPVNIPEEEITLYHGTPHDLPPVSELISHKDGSRVYVDRNQYPDWTQHPDLEPADYEFVKNHEMGKFDSDMIGTGEGNQAYGHGLYFAERKGTAESYRKALSSKVTPAVREEYFKEGRIVEGYGGKDKVLGYNKGKDGTWSVEVVRVNDDGTPKEGARPRVHSTQPNVSNVESVLGPLEEGGNLYEVKVKAKPEEFLDYDSIIDEESLVGQKIFQDENTINSIKNVLSNELFVSGQMTKVSGGKLLFNMEYTLGPEKTAKILENAGIKGIRYKDAQTRFSKEGATYNYVVFDDKLIDISKKYGITLFGAGLVVGGMATPNQVQAQENPIGAPAPDPGTADAAANDTTADYLSVANNSTETPAQRALRRAEQAGLIAPKPKVQPGRTGGARGARGGEPDDAKAKALLKDVGTGILETPRAILSGFLKATEEAGEALESVFGQLPTAGEDYKPIRIKSPESVTGQVAESISQFITGFVPALKATKAVGLAKSAPYAAGFIADATVFDPHEERLSDLAIELGFDNQLTQYLAADPDDSRAEGMLKSGLEGLALGGFADAIFKIAKVIKGGKNVKKEADAAGETVEEFVGPKLPELVGPQKPDVDVPTARPDVEEQEFIPFSQVADEAAAEVPAPKAPDVKVGDAAPKEAAKNINLNRLETTDDVKEFLDAAAEADAPSINAARRETITQEQTEALADDLGMTVDDLLARRGGEAFNAEQAVAARKLLVASGENLIKLAQKAKNGGDEAVAVFRRAMAQHRAIQLQVSGMTAEAGRALQSFRIMAQSAAEQERMIKEAIEASGGLDANQAIAKNMADMADGAAAGRYVSKVYKATVLDMIQEFWVNSLLSSLGTHAMNITSNASVIALSVLERKVAGAFGKSVANKEANAMMLGILEGARDGFKLAAKAFKTGEPSDTLMKQEVATKKSITAEQLNASGMLGRMADFVGSVVRVPGRALLASDEFFKSIAYRQELHARAYRTAINEGLEGEDFVKRVQGILENPPKDIRMDAVNFARVQTFTNELGDIGKSATQLRNKLGAPGTFVAPFIRTPVNVVKYAMARTPLAPLMPTVKADIDAGGARRDLALAKIGTGSAFMMIAGMMQHNGQLTGAGPTDPDMRKILEMSGWKPNSILIGDKYISLERADPIASVLLLSANLFEILGQVEDDTEFDDLAIAGIFTVTNFLSSKTFFNGIVEAVSAMEGATRDPNNQSNSVVRWLSRLGASFVPAGVASVTRAMDPTMRVTSNMIERVQARIPGYSSDLPPRRNMFGDIIVLEGGLGPDIMSPFYMSTKKEDPIVNEMIANEMDLAMPRRTIDGVELTSEQYDRYVQLSAGMGGKLPSLKKAMLAIIRSSRYKRLTDGPNGGKTRLLRTAYNNYKSVARRELMEEFPELKSEVMSARVKSREELTGRTVSEAQRRRLGILAGEE